MLRLLRQGITGEDVRAVQQGLNVWAAGSDTIDPTGFFGTHTDTAVRRFQGENDLQVDGIVGPFTRRALFPTAVMTSGVIANVLRMPKFGTRGTGPAPISGPAPFAFGGTPVRTASFGFGDQPDEPSILPDIVPQLLPDKLFQPTRFPRLIPRLAAPTVPAPLSLLGFQFDHCELAPGTQHSFPFTRKVQNSFVMTAQCITARGDPDNAHQELTFGAQFGQPIFTSDKDGNAWTLNPFVQLTDVDRFGSIGAFHFWQPYAQAGFQGAGVGAFTPTITGSAFPFNLGLDAGKFLTFTAAGGIFVNYDIDAKKVLVGPQVTFGVNIKIFSLF